jgi:Leucine-rich repeat (LRR) protein
MLLLQPTLPTTHSIGKMHSLNLLYLSNNRLSGPIPPCFTKLARLQYLYLLNNDLSGPLPAAFGNLTELLFFNLGSNRVSGEVPASFIGLKKLQLLYLNNNSFSGSFPRGLPASLTKMSLECNQFSGPLPLFEHLRNLVGAVLVQVLGAGV